MTKISLLPALLRVILSIVASQVKIPATIILPS
jgi:hypothetical protein